MTIVAGFLQLAMAPMLRRMRALLPSEIDGVVIAIVGLSVASLGLQYGLGITDRNGFEPKHLAITGISLVTMIVLNIWTKGYGKMFCALIGVSVGYVASAAFGLLDIAPLLPEDGLGILRLPSVEQISWHFDFTLLAPFAVVAVATTLRAMGDVANAERLNDKDWVRPRFGPLAGGVAANGLASILCAIAATTRLNTYSAAVGLAGATGITRRVVGYGAGVAFALLSLVPAAAVGGAALPTPGICASMFFSSAFLVLSRIPMVTPRPLAPPPGT